MKKIMKWLLTPSLDFCIGLWAGAIPWVMIGMIIGYYILRK